MARLCIGLMVIMACGCGDSGSGADLGPDQGVPSDLGAGADLAVTGDLAVPDLAATSSVARGQELVQHLLLCGTCHTTPDAAGAPSTNPADYLAGGRKFTVMLPGDGGAVTVYAPNITPDNATGVGMWSESQIADAVKVGVDNQGMPLWPTMPYPRFANLTDDDAVSIALYLKSLPPASHMVPDDSAHPVQAASRFDYTSIPHTTLPSTDPGFASAERGRYLANVACLTCHTVNGGPPAGVDVAKAYAGGRSFGAVKSQNLTPDATGLAGWSTADLVATLKTDKEKGTGRMLLPPMPGGMGIDHLGGLTDADLADLAQFIHTLPPVVNGPFGPPDM